MTPQHHRRIILNRGVQSLREFGYNSVTVENILTDDIFRRIFRKMLSDSLDGATAEARAVVSALIEEIKP